MKAKLKSKCLETVHMSAVNEAEITELSNPELIILKNILLVNYINERKLAISHCYRYTKVL